MILSTNMLAGTFPTRRLTIDPARFLPVGVWVYKTKRNAERGFGDEPAKYEGNVVWTKLGNLLIRCYWSKTADSWVIVIDHKKTVVLRVV